MSALNALFLVWGPPSHGPRSRVLAQELGIPIEFIYTTGRRGLLIAPYKYAAQTVKTLRLLLRRRPSFVFVQSPPSFAAVVVSLYAAIARVGFVVDTHSDALQSPWWTRPRWLYRLVARAATATIVTNRHYADHIEAQGGKALILRDIPTDFPAAGPQQEIEGFAVLVVNTFANDEPLAQILAAAAGLPAVEFFVTGRSASPPPATANVHYTGFLPDPHYYDLMRSCSVVMCLTTRDHTMQRGACEALSIGKPIITSNWPLLREYFHQGSLHVDNQTAGIVGAVEEMRSNLVTYQAEIHLLQSEQRTEWESARASLLAVVSGASELVEA